MDAWMLVKIWWRGIEMNDRCWLMFLARTAHVLSAFIGPAQRKELVWRPPISSKGQFF
jgi:hypothetical protein